MASRKVVLPVLSYDDIKKELEYLYGRRAAVDALIRSLEQYIMYEPKQENLKKRKSA